MKKSFTMKSIAITLAALTLLPAAGMVGAEQVDDTAYSDISAPNYAEDTVTEEAPADDQISEIEDNAGADEMVYPVDEGIADDEVTGTSDIEETTDPECESMANDEVTGTSAVEETTDPECESMANDEVTGTSAVEETTDPECESMTNDEVTGTSAVEETTDPETESINDEETGTSAVEETTDTTDETTDENALPVTITFDTDGGSEIESITDVPGTPVIIPEDPVKEGFIFTGWDTEIPELMPETDMTITALWEEDEEAKERKFWEDLMKESDDYIAQAEAVQNISLPAGPYTINQSNYLNFMCTGFGVGANISGLDKKDQDNIFDKIWDLDNALIDDIAKELPFGNTLTKPLKWMMGALNGKYYGDDCADKKERMIKELGDKMDQQFDETMTRLDMIDNRLGEISGQISTATDKIDALAEKANKLSDQMDKDSKWVSVMTQNTTKLTECNSILNDIDSRVFGIDGLYHEITVIENDDTLNPQQKLVAIAVLNRDPRMLQLRNDLDNLTKKMTGANTALTSNYFELIELYNRQGVMFSSEAKAETRECANAISQEYLAAMLVALRTMDAEKAVADFTVEDCMRLTTMYSDDWMACKKNSITLIGKGNSKGKFDILAENTAKAMTGYIDFVSKNDNTNYFVNSGKDNLFIGATTKVIIPRENVNSLEEAKKFVQNQLNETVNSSIVDTQSIKALVQYVKTNKPGTSLKQFLEQQGVIVNTAAKYEENNDREPIYVILDTTYTETTDSGLRQMKAFKGYDNATYRFCNVKVIDIDDPELKVQEVPFMTINDRPGMMLGSARNYSLSYQYFNALIFADGEDVEENPVAIGGGGLIMRNDWIVPCTYGSDPFKGATRYEG
ncbi:MAG: InlB B-repeat-containing protein [Oscillospiraceae bacterium]|nr:InlB B-repeat-containing protein [Oscillospiraceae bacterium]